MHGHLPSAPVGFAHRFARVNGLRFHFVTGGANAERDVVLLAGFPESWFAWRHVMPILGERFRVVAIDLPGQGDSDRPIDGYDTQTVAERVHQLVRHLGLSRTLLPLTTSALGSPSLMLCCSGTRSIRWW
jgi:pimeloyl-ACP methyl ester carboxylesterase